MTLAQLLRPLKNACPQFLLILKEITAHGYKYGNRYDLLLRNLIVESKKKFMDFMYSGKDDRCHFYTISCFDSNANPYQRFLSLEIQDKPKSWEKVFKMNVFYNNACIGGMRSSMKTYYIDIDKWEKFYLIKIYTEFFITVDRTRTTVGAIPTKIRYDIIKSIDEEIANCIYENMLEILNK